jgi:hypothetical protein
MFADVGGDMGHAPPRRTPAACPAARPHPDKEKQRSLCLSFFPFSLWKRDDLPRQARDNREEKELENAKGRFSHRPKRQIPCTPPRKAPHQSDSFYRVFVFRMSLSIACLG